MAAVLRHARALALVALVASASAAPWLPDVDRQLDAARREADGGRPEIARAYAQTVAPSELTVAWAEEAPIRDPRLLRAVRGAVDRWNRALAGTVRLAWTDDRPAAQVLIYVAERLQEGGRSFAGYSRWTRTVARQSQEPAGRLSVEVQLARLGPGGRELSGDERLHAALHELGHALGLSDSTDPGSVMSPLGLGSPRTAPSEDDVRAVRALHAEVRRLLAP